MLQAPWERCRNTANYDELIYLMTTMDSPAAVKTAAQYCGTVVQYVQAKTAGGTVTDQLAQPLGGVSASVTRTSDSINVDKLGRLSFIGPIQALQCPSGQTGGSESLIIKIDGTTIYPFDSPPYLNNTLDMTLADALEAAHPGATASLTSATLTIERTGTPCNGYCGANPSPLLTLNLSLGVIDIDGNVYKTVTIGNQTWLKENLKVTKYRNGDAIPTTTASIPYDSSSKYQWAYGNSESNAATYGRLYTWYAATDSRGLCPTGWHLPTDAEWTTLTDYLGGLSAAGGKMKEAETSHWNSPNAGADNSSGFTALPGGYRSLDGAFYGIGLDGLWWSGTEGDSTYGWYRLLHYSYGDATRYLYNKNNGFSVRCVRD